MVKFSSAQVEESLTSQTIPFYGARGSIVRLRIIDFMTYHDVEMKAGPNVNLVMGPNGTGKSTIVCAICLGLAGKPKSLGRANSLREYIRHGATEATVEIELFNGNGLKNYIVKRTIRETASGGQNSEWWLNSKRATEKQIEELMKDLNIQLDNLCQFLPQDRVQDFARMDQIQLLSNTQKSVDDGSGLLGKHTRLIELKDEIANLNESLRKTNDHLKIETTHASRMEHEVRSFQQREEIVNSVQEYEGKKLWLQYVNAQDEFMQQSEELNEAKQKHKKEEKLIAPLKKEIDGMKQKLNELTSKMTALRNQTISAFDQQKHMYQDACYRTQCVVHENNARFKNAQNQERDRTRRLNEKIERLKHLRHELEASEKSGTYDEATYAQNIRQYEARIAELTQHISRIESDIATDMFDKEAEQGKLRVHEGELKKMKEFRSSRMRYLERQKQDVAKATKYIFDPQNHQEILDNFAGRIREPMILHLYVADKDFGNIAERHIPGNDLTAFFCEEKEDVKRLISFTKAKGWHVSVIHHKMPDNYTKPVHPPFDDLKREYDFQRNLLDLVQVIDVYYMSYLTKTVLKERVLIGTDKTDKMITQIMDRTSLKYYYTRKHAVSIRESYYSKNKNATTSYLNEASIFTDKINSTETDRIQESVASSRELIERLQNKINSRQPELTKLKDERSGYEKQIDTIKSNVDYRKKTIIKIKNCEDFIRNTEKEKQDLEKIRKEGVIKSHAAQLEQLKAGKKYVDNVTLLIGNLSELEVIKRQTEILQRHITVKQNEYEEAKTNVTHFQGEIKQLTAKVTAASDAAAKFKKEAREKTKSQEAPVDIQNKEIDVAKVDQHISTLTARLEFLPQPDPKVISNYHARQKKIQELLVTKENGELELAARKAESERLKHEWLDPLQELIQKIRLNFSGFFQEMGCVGEVLLAKGDDENDFSKYGIKIMVKFRDIEPLVELTGWKQSGGERAITTALYILALQSLTNVPFRVIDEINQGMDAKNEARFFRLLCTLAQGNDSPQYFLLTPKMLPPVDYPDNVDFHIIFNGPYVKVGWRDAVTLAEESSGEEEDEGEDDNDDSSSDDDDDEEEEEDEEDDDEGDRPQRVREINGEREEEEESEGEGSRSGSGSGSGSSGEESSE